MYMYILRFEILKTHLHSIANQQLFTANSYPKNLDVGKMVKLSLAIKFTLATEMVMIGQKHYQFCYTRHSITAEKILLSPLDYNNFRTELHRQAHTSNERVLSSLDLLLPQFGGWPYSHTHCCLAKTVLEPRQIHLNVLPEQYVELYLQYLQSKGMI